MTSLPASATTPPTAPPPGSRRAEIALVAAEEFTRRGYHSTRVEHIAEKLGVTPGALYRHVSGKYEMFRDAVLLLNVELAEATRSVPAGDLGALVASVTAMTMEHRRRAALYRWQGRYLSADDRAAVSATNEEIRRRFAAEVRAHRGLDPARPDPETARGSRSAGAAILSTIASLGDHRVRIATDDAVGLLVPIASGLALTLPPATAGLPGSTGAGVTQTTNGVPAPPVGAGAAGVTGAAVPRLRKGAATREAAITAAIARFHRDGYDDVTMETIGADVGVAASALYRHFSGKSALLTAAVDRTAAFVEANLDRHAALHRAPDGTAEAPATALADLLDAYVGIVFSHGPELMLYYSELGILDPADRQRILDSQRRQFRRWVRLVCEASPASSPGATPEPATAPATEPATGSVAGSAAGPAQAGGSATTEATARVRVQAALAVVLDGGRVVGYHPATASRYDQLARVPLLGGQASGSTAPRE